MGERDVKGVKGKARRKLLALGFGSGLIILLELLLRGFNIAPLDTPLPELYFKPEPVFVREGDYFRSSRQSQKHHLDQRFQAVKPRNGLRVFIIGGSAAMGFPLEGFFGPNQLLPLGLAAAAPGRSYEVVNVSGFGFAAYRLVPLVEEILDHEPDAIIALTGNNEFLERRFHDRGFWLRSLERLRLYRLMAGLLSAARGEAAEVRWEEYPVTDRVREQALENYRRNLEQIASRCAARSTPLILLTVPVNLKDYRPLGDSRADPDQQRAIDQALQAGELDRAQAMLQPLLENFPDDAWLLYEQAWLYHLRAAAEGKDELNRKAAELFAAAREKDPRPVRALSAMNETLRGLGRAGKAALVADAAAAFEEAAVLPGAPGDELFFDHCHLNASGQELLARLMVKALIGTGALDPPADWEDRFSRSLQKRRDKVRDASWADGIYIMGYETGMNMGRVCRGYRLAREAHALDPDHQKARMLVEALEPRFKDAYCLTGD